MTETTPDDAEIERLRAENSELREQVQDLAESVHSRRRTRLRTIAVGVLVALSAITFTGATMGVWARRTALNTDVFVQRATAIGQDPSVQAALADYLTDQIMAVADPRALIVDALPPPAGTILAPPLTNAIRGFVHDRVTAFLATDTFLEVWTKVVTTGHEGLVRLIKGESQVISTNGDTLTINLVPVINALLARIGEVSPELFGKSITLPTLTVDDIPEVAKEKLASALGRPVPQDFGVIQVQGAGEALSTAQQAVRLANLAVLALVVLTFVFVPLAIWLSIHRRRTILQLALASAVGLVLARRLMMGLQSELLEQVKVSANRSAADAVMHELIDPFLSATTLLLWALLAAVAVCLVTGPYHWAVWFRTLLSRLFSGGTTALAGAVTSERATPAVDWVRTHTGTLQAVGTGVAVFILLVFNLSWSGVLVLAVLLGAYLAAVWWISSGRAEQAADSTDAPPSGTPTPAPG